MKKSKSAVLLVSAARTSTPAAIELDASQTFTTGNSNSATIDINFDQLLNAHIIIDVTSITLTPVVTPVLEALDEASGKYYDLIDSIANITATGTTVLRIGQDIAPAANLAAQDFIPKKVRLTLTHADADSITYSVGINYQESD